MDDTGDEASSYVSGYTTPPLSPTKTISTEGCLSPRTPGSPRKSRSCLFFRDIDGGADGPFFTPPSSPTKFKFASRLSALSIPELLPVIHDSAPSQSDDDSPHKQEVPQDIDRPPPCPSPTLAGLHGRSSPFIATHSDTQAPAPPIERDLSLTFLG